MAELTHKTCSSCRQTLPINLFSAQQSYKDGYRGQCRPCRASKTKDYIKRTGYKSQQPREPAKDRIRHLKRKYGLDANGYDKLLSAQGGVCAICGRQPDKLGLRVDHCHKTGLVRGLLCNQCNTGLGMLGDCEAGLVSALAYIKSDKILGQPSLLAA